MERDKVEVEKSKIKEEFEELVMIHREQGEFLKNF